MAGRSQDLAYAVRVQDAQLRELQRNLKTLNRTMEQSDDAARVGGRGAAREYDKLNRSITHVEKTAINAHRRLSSIGKGLVISTAATVGLYGVANALHSIVKAGADAETSDAKLHTQLDASGISYTKRVGEIERVIRAQSDLAGVDDELAQDSLTNLIRTTKDANEAYGLNALALDISAAKHISLETASKLVAKIWAGNTTVLSRYGFVIAKGTSSTEALTLAQKAFGGQAEAAGRTATGTMQRFDNDVENLKEAFAGGLLPVLTEVTDKISTKLADPATLRRVEDLGNEVADKLQTALTAVGDWFDTHWDDIQTGFEVGGDALTIAATAATTLAGALKDIASIVPGDDTTNMLEILAGLYLGKKALGGKGAAAYGLLALGGKKGGAGGAAGLAVMAPGPLKLAALGLITYNLASGSGAALAKGFGEPVAQTRDGRLVYQKSHKLYVRGKGAGAMGAPITIRGAAGTPVTLYRYEPPANAVGTHGEGRDKFDLSKTTKVSDADAHFGVPLTGGADKKKPKTKKKPAPAAASRAGRAVDPAELPVMTQLRVAVAEGTPGKSDDLRAFREVERILKERLSRAVKTSTKIALTNAVNDITGRINSILSEQEQQAKARASERLDAIRSGREVGRSLIDAREKLAHARRVGDPGLIREAQRELEDAQLERERLRQEGVRVTTGKAKTGRGPGSARMLKDADPWLIAALGGSQEARQKLARSSSHAVGSLSSAREVLEVHVYLEGKEITPTVRSDIQRVGRDNANQRRGLQKNMRNV